MENNTRKFKEKYDIVTKSCVECGYENFPKFSNCKLCQRSINNDEQSTMIAYLDVDTGSHPWVENGLLVLSKIL